MEGKVPTRRFVLIAAVSTYRHESIPALPGVRRDAEAFRAVLHEHADGGVHRFFWLADGGASKQQILEALQALVGEAGATDQVVLYFGGHGWREWDICGQRWSYFFLPHD